MGAEWANAHLRTFRRIPYIHDRDTRQCRRDSCFRNGVILTLHGQHTKRGPVHIEESSMSM